MQRSAGEGLTFCVQGGQSLGVRRLRQFCGDFPMGCATKGCIYLLFVCYLFAVQLFIKVGRTSQRFLTESEQAHIIDLVRLPLRNQHYRQALKQVIGACLHERVRFHCNVADLMRAEFNGEPDTRVDIGTLSLVSTVSVALFFVVVVTGTACCGEQKTRKAMQDACALFAASAICRRPTASRL